MVLHVDVKKLVEGSIIETNRVEYKTSWNPQKVLHTICAFANDYEETYGGYIVIGVSETNGIPDTVVGVEESEIPRIEAEFFNICNLIEPRYIPGFYVEEVDGKKVIVIWASGDPERPFKCPVKLQSSNKEQSERGYFIRRSAHTIRANSIEEQTLIKRKRTLCFDEQINPQSSENDISRDIILDYLNRIDTSLTKGNPSKKTLIESLRLVSGPPEMRCAVNAALLMFNDDPERFFEGCRIELVEKPDPTGNNMTETVFKGPVYLQIKRVLQTINNGIIKEKIFKVDGQAEAVRIKNYPYEAIEEAVVNAVYHKDFLVREPVVITVTPNTLEIVTYPGLDPGITDDEIKKVDFKSFFVRNIRIGDFLKDIDLVEERNTGIPKIKRALRKNGSPMPEYHTDKDRRYLEVVFHTHPAFHVDTGDEDESSEPVTIEGMSMDQRIIMMLERNGCMTTREISAGLGYSNITKVVRTCIESMMDEGLIRYLYPDNPRDPRQKICLKR